MLSCVLVMTLAGCGMSKGQQVDRPVFAVPERPAVVSRDDDSYRTTAQPREPFFRRVFFGRSNGQ